MYYKNTVEKQHRNNRESKFVSWLNYWKKCKQLY